MRETIDALFGSNPKAAFRHRLEQCLHATSCGRICERLVKAPGKRVVLCVDIRTDDERLLYEALAEPNFHCPMLKF